MILMKDIVTDDNKLLREKSVDVQFPLSEEDAHTMDEMIEYIDNSQDEVKAVELNIQPGVGIAAPQIGILKKMFVVKAPDEKGTIHHYALINPKLISNSVMDSYLATGEGCLSVKEFHGGYVKRHYKIKMKAYDYLSKQNVVLSLKGYVAVVLQHEYDHLFGILYYDHINKKDPLKPIDGAYIIE